MPAHQHLDREHVRIAVADWRAGDLPSKDSPADSSIPFFTTKAAGHGLGLAVSQNILMEHGGQITFEHR